MQKDKKKFKDTKMGAFLKVKAPKVLEVVGDLVPDGGLLEAVGKMLAGDPEADPLVELEFARLRQEFLVSEAQEVTKRWEADLKQGSWLPRHIRPIVLLALTASVIVYAGVDGVDGLGFTLGPRWTEMLTTLTTVVFTAYFGGRTWEKVKAS